MFFFCRKSQLNVGSEWLLRTVHSNYRCPRLTEGICHFIILRVDAICEIRSGLEIHFSLV
jgi:hypothetical protein